MFSSELKGVLSGSLHAVTGFYCYIPVSGGLSVGSTSVGGGFQQKAVEGSTQTYCGWFQDLGILLSSWHPAGWNKRRLELQHRHHGFGSSCLAAAREAGALGSSTSVHLWFRVALMFPNVVRIAFLWSQGKVAGMTVVVCADSSLFLHTCKCFSYPVMEGDRMQAGAKASVGKTDLSSSFLNMS